MASKIALTKWQGGLRATPKRTTLAKEKTTLEANEPRGRIRAGILGRVMGEKIDSWD
jgi:hypothetical protein